MLLCFAGMVEWMDGWAKYIVPSYIMYTCIFLFKTLQDVLICIHFPCSNNQKEDRVVAGTELPLLVS